MELKINMKTIKNNGVKIAVIGGGVTIHRN